MQKIIPLDLVLSLSTLTTLTLTAVTLTAVTALPATADETNPQQLDDIYVTTAYKAPAQWDNTGSSVTVLTPEDFDQLNAVDVLDVIKSVPGVSITQSGGRGTLSSVFMRGADSDQTLVIIDGIKVNNPGANGAYNFGTLSLNDVERIEVLRGEQSALWGSEAIGGVISIQTTTGKNADKPFNAKVKLGGGSNATAESNVSLYGKEGAFYYAINANKTRTNGISAASENTFHYTNDQGTQIISGGASEDDSYQSGSGSIRLGADFERAGIEVLMRHTSITSHYDNGPLIREAGDTNFDFSQENDGNPSTKTNENLIKLEGFVGNPDDRIHQRAYISHMSNNSYFSGRFGDSINNADKRNLGYQLDVNFDQDGAAEQAISAYLEYTKDKMDGFNGNNSLSQNSAAVEYRWFHDNDHAFSAGLRYDDNDLFKDDTTFRLAGGFRINDLTRLHASIGTGIKNPTLIDLYGFGGGFQGNPNLKPEKSLGGELGVTLTTTDDRHRVNFTYFNRRLDDAISARSVQDANGDFTREAFNIDGKTRVDGFEAGYQGELTDKLTLSANYTYTNSEDPDGNALIRRPKHQASSGLNYQINDQWQAHADVTHVGKRDDAYFDNNTFQQVGVELPSYTVFNLGTRYTLNKHHTLYLNANNIFDENYENTIGFGQPERNFFIGYQGQW
ncbi:TonB-dependent receptor plug domain-containing protein [Ostreibacterium oceani]|nr:TonB-dependent receptor [Ostreibacterium oceani]